MQHRSWRIGRGVRLTGLALICIVILYAAYVAGVFWAESVPVLASSVSISGDGKTVAVGSHQGQILLMKLEKGRQYVVRMPGIAWVTNVALSFCGRRLAFTGLRTSDWSHGRPPTVVGVYDLGGCTLRTRLLWEKAPKEIIRLAFCDRAGWVLVATVEEGEPLVWAIPDNESRRGSGRVLAGMDVIDCSTGAVVHRLPAPANDTRSHFLRHRCVKHFERDWFACANIANAVFIWMAGHASPVRLYQSRGVVRLLAFRDTDLLVAETGEAGRRAKGFSTLVCINVDTRRVRWRTRIGPPSLSLAEADASGRLLVGTDNGGREVVVLSVEEDGAHEAFRWDLAEVPGLRGWPGWQQVGGR